MIIPFTQAAQIVAELHDITVWRCRVEFDKQAYAFPDD